MQGLYHREYHHRSQAMQEKWPFFDVVLSAVAKDDQAGAQSPHIPEKLAAHGFKRWTP